MSRVLVVLKAVTLFNIVAGVLLLEFAPRYAGAFLIASGLGAMFMIALEKP